MYTIKFTPRLYQETILKTALTKNTLVVLGTGLGKTKIGIMLAIQRLNSYPNSKILFLTPTKPLADQIQKEFQKETNVNAQEIALFTGAVQPKKRQEIASNSKIIISTPQTVSNDIINSRINLEEFSLLVVDEAHRAVKDYDYVWIAKEYHKKSKFPRILALTASPGSDMDTIGKVCKNLKIEEIEVRTDSDPDVQQYIQPLEIDWIKVSLPEEYKSVVKFIDDALSQRFAELKHLNVIQSARTTKKELLNLQAQLHSKLSRGEKDFTLFRSVSIIAETLKLQHAKELAETQNIEALYKYMNLIYASAEKTKVKAVKSIARDLNFRSAYVQAEKLVQQKIEHPKITELKKIISSEIEKNPNVKVIVFNNFRDSAQHIANQLEPIAKSQLFVGQQKKSGTGMTQKQQIQVLKDFAEGKFNILIATAIGEEGLDIEKVDLVIFYEPIPSAIRSIQRRGRTARLEKGRVIVLMTKNTTDESYHWIAYHKEKNMYNILKNIKDKLQFDKPGMFNGQEQPTLKQFFQPQKLENLKIFADTREKGSQIVKELSSQGIQIATQNLNTDYVVSEKCGIELKTKTDFINSIIDKRLLHQLKNLKQNFERPIIILQGEEDIYSIRKVHPNAIRGMLATIACSYQIPIIHSQNPRETVELIKAVALREQDFEKKGFALNTGKKPLTTKEQQEFIVQSFPNIGPATAKSLLNEFKTIKSIVNSDSTALQKIDNLGQKKADEILKLLNEHYEE